jgi:hypothetical protein
VFEHTKLALSVWFLGIYLVTQSKNAISALELKRQLGIAYKAQKMIDFMDALPSVDSAAPNLSLADINALVHKLRP